ncbi:HAD family hydrolase [Mycobacterium marinum]|uniref:HAD family hydrolase n=1 Tax=Mycobacterium marinum TaxID=1781 RepID=UPI003569C3EC
MRPDLSPNSTRAILFDLDGTLVDSAPAMMRGLNEMARRRGAPPVEVASVRRWVSLGGQAMLRGALGVQADPLGDLDEFRDILRRQSADPADLYPGVPAMLAALKQDGYSIAICTNKREDIAVPYAAGLGIAANFDAIVGGAPGRELKPDPQLARMALERLRANAHEAILVGDSEIDADTAIAAGLRFVLVTFGYPHGDIDAIPADARIDGFDELPCLVSAVFSDGCTRHEEGTRR